jgi:hypothetical protein
MPIVRPYSPTPAERRQDEEKGSFQTHSSYLRAFTLLSGYRDGEDEASSLNRVAALVRTSPSLGVRPAKAATPEAVYPILVSAWGTELLLALNELYAKGDELVRVSNNWCVVQLYYLLYHATQALVVARGNERPTTHQATQRHFMDFWVKKALSIPPWTLGVGPSGYRNVPSGRQIREIHPWSACNADTCWDIAGMALKTTRRDALYEAINRKRTEKQRAARKVWREEEKKRQAIGRKAREEPRFRLPILKPAEKKGIEASLRDYTFMDYLYRLRIKANYEDGSMFIDGPRDDVSSQQLRQYLIRLASTSLLLNELHMVVSFGKASMLNLVDKWLGTSHPKGMAVGLALRHDILRNF